MKPQQPTIVEKNEISGACQPLIEKFRSQYIKNIPDKNRNNYPVDIYTKWHRNYFYFCEKFCSDSVNRINDQFEEKFVRLEYTGRDDFSFAYFRHIGKWWIVAEHINLDRCLREIESNPSFHPI